MTVLLDGIHFVLVYVNLTSSVLHCYL